MISTLVMPTLPFLTSKVGYLSLIFYTTIRGIPAPPPMAHTTADFQVPNMFFLVFSCFFLVIYDSRIPPTVLPVLTYFIPTERRTPIAKLFKDTEPPYSFKPIPLPPRTPLAEVLPHDYNFVTDCLPQRKLPPSPIIRRKMALFERGEQFIFTSDF